VGITTDRIPTQRDAIEIATAFTGLPPHSAVRFPTGLAYYVYDVVTARAGGLVVRIGKAGDEDEFAAAGYWSERQRPLGVPLPALLEGGSHAGLPYLVLERLPGTDLGLVYASLSTAEKRRVAAQVVEIQRAVRGLPEGEGFGFARTCAGSFLHRSWQGFLRASLARSRSRIDAAGVTSAAPVSHVECCVARLDRYLGAVRPTAFLDDTTTKNVIMHWGSVSGIVDVDRVCFGDPLLTVALTRTALVNHGQDADYIEFWCELLEPTAEQRHALGPYTALFCMDFLSEFGQRLNRDQPLALDPIRLGRLHGLLDEALTEA
jgi:aminoglycoside phosphotransferase (APT) family kinase protein